MRCSKHDCNQYALASSVGGGLCRTHFYEQRTTVEMDRLSKLVSVLASVNEWAI